MKNIVIGPGAMGYFAHLGAIARLNSDGRLGDVQTISGSSAGSLLAVMCLLYDFDMWKILSESLKIPLTSLSESADIQAFISDYGFISQEVTRELITSVIGSITFKELYEKNPIIVYITSFCIEYNKTVYFSVETHPDMSIVDALCMSIAMPFLFSPIKYNGVHYIDGALLEAFPIVRVVHDPPEDTLILQLKYSYESKMGSFGGYLATLLNIPMSLRKTYGKKSHEIYLGDINTFDFKMTEDQKLHLFVTGFLSF